MNEQYEFSSMKQLGLLFGVGNHKIGKWLKQCGLRDDDGKPSYEAFQGEYVKATANPNGYGYFYAWATDATTKALEDAGHQQITSKSSSLSVPQFSGPFESRLKNNACKFELVDATGFAGITVEGEENAALLVKLLNLASKSGFCFRNTSLDEAGHSRASHAQAS